MAGNCPPSSNGVPGPYRAVEEAIAKGDAQDVGGARDRVFEVPDRPESAVHLRRWIRVERILLGLDRTAVPDVGPPGEALGQDPPCACRAGGLHQVVEASGPQLVRRLELGSKFLRLVESLASDVISCTPELGALGTWEVSPKSLRLGKCRGFA
jgi:hypothetical protein